MNENLYEILGVNKDASQEEIKKNFRKLAMEHHPDRGGSEDEFKKINQAYETLSDESKRQNYDMGGSDNQRFQSHGFDMSDLFSQFGDIFGGHRQNRTRRGSDIGVHLNISLEDALFGSQKKVKYKRQVMCSPCNGKGGTDTKNCTACNGSGNRTIRQQTQFGFMSQMMTCNICNGSGKIITSKCKTCFGEGSLLQEEIIDISVPKGIDTGMQLNLSQKGNFIRDGVPGDLHILINQHQDIKFKRESNNLYCDEWINISDAVLGTTLNIDTPHGPLSFIIGPGCESGKVFKSIGKGVPILSNDGQSHRNGDMYIKVNVTIPKNISEKERIIFEELKNNI